MMIVRPITQNDLPALLDLVKETGSGLTSLPADAAALAQRIQRAEKTWLGLAPPAEQGYVFVLEERETGALVGISAIEAAVGLDDPWYNYRVGTLVHAAKDLGVYNVLPTLFLTNDHTGASELCSLFLHPSARRSGHGALLSKSRFLFMDAFRHCFSAKVVAEMRGVSDAKGYSPFWDSLGSRFFSMPFSQADYLCGTGKKAFIAELMPKHPIYVSFLSRQGQAAIGQVHPDTRPARQVLEKEGFRYLNYIDIFDGGPTIECDLDRIETIRNSRQMDLEIGPVSREGLTLSLVSNDRLRDFRALLYYADLQHDHLVLPAEVARALHCQPGDRLRVAPLYKENSQ